MNWDDLKVLLALSERAPSQGGGHTLCQQYDGDASLGISGGARGWPPV